MYNLAIFISGPETSYSSNYRETALQFLNKAAKTVLGIGDGHRDIINSDFISGEILDKLSLLEPVYANEKVLVLLHCHGQTKDGLHLVKLDSFNNDNWYSTKNIFSLLANTLNCPIDIIFESCGAHGAIEDVNILPTKSTVMLTREFAAMHMPFISMRSVLDYDVSLNLEVYFQNYIARLDVDSRPILVTSNGVIIDPVECATKFLGNHISIELQEQLIQKFAEYICYEDQNIMIRFKQIIQKFQMANAINEFVQFGSDAVKNIMRIHLQILKELPKFSDLSLFKEYADNLFAINNIPLLINIADDFWKKDAYIFSEKFLHTEEEIIQEQSIVFSENGLLEILTLNPMYIKTSGYACLDSKDYGMVLWIIYSIIVDNLKIIN